MPWTHRLPPKHACLLCVCVCVRVSKQTDDIFVLSVASLCVRDAPGCVQTGGGPLGRLPWELFYPSPCVSCTMAMPWTHRLPPETRLSSVCVRVCACVKTNRRHFRAVRRKPSSQARVYATGLLLRSNRWGPSWATDIGGYSTPRPVRLAPWPCLGLIDCPPWHTPVFCVCACVKFKQTAFSCRLYRRNTYAQHPCAVTVRRLATAGVVLPFAMLG
jgi:hypothetical protein